MFIFFFQAEDGIRDGHVTGVQTCALPISEERTLSGSFTYTARDFADATTWAGENADALAPLVSSTVRPEEAQEAFRSLAAGEGPPGKILVTFDDEPHNDTGLPAATEHSARSEEHTSELQSRG